MNYDLRNCNSTLTSRVTKGNCHRQLVPNTHPFI